MSKEKNLYGNWLVLDPRGGFLSYGSEKRAMWYVNRELAVIVKDRTIKLNFEPRGYNTDEYTLQKKINKCVNCGTTEITKLTKHHVIPSMYKKLFPLKYKARSSHDIVIMCRDCHNEYEQQYADKLKQYLSEKYNAPLQIPYRENQTIKSIMICRTILKHWDDIPGDRLESLLNDFNDINGYELNDFEQMYEFIENNTIEYSLEQSHSKIVLDNYETIDFIIMWRQHFIDSMSPKFMPDGWDVNYTDFYKEIT